MTCYRNRHPFLVDRSGRAGRASRRSGSVLFHRKAHANTGWAISDLAARNRETRNFRQQRLDRPAVEPVRSRPSAYDLRAVGDGLFLDLNVFTGRQTALLAFFDGERPVIGVGIGGSHYFSPLLSSHLSSQRSKRKANNVPENAQPIRMTGTATTIDAVSQKVIRNRQRQQTQRMNSRQLSHISQYSYYWWQP